MPDHAQLDAAAGDRPRADDARGGGAHDLRRDLARQRPAGRRSGGHGRGKRASREERTSPGRRSSAARPTPPDGSSGRRRARRRTCAGRSRGSSSRAATTASCSIRAALPTASRTAAGPPRARAGCSGRRRTLWSAASSHRVSRISSSSVRSIGRRSRCTSRAISRQRYQGHLEPLAGDGILIVEGPGRSGLALSADGSGERQLLLEVRREGAADRDLPRALRASRQQSRVGRHGELSQGGLSPAAVRGPPRRARAGGARPAVRRRPDRELLRRRPGRGASGRLARHAVPLRLDAEGAHRLLLLLGRPLLAGEPASSRRRRSSAPTRPTSRGARSWRSTRRSRRPRSRAPTSSRRR